MEYAVGVGDGLGAVGLSAEHPARTPARPSTNATMIILCFMVVSRISGLTGSRT
jgi:hypothetical protein